jgi:hypothetical protein
MLRSIVRSLPRASGASGGLKFSGRLKVEGYGAQELLEVKNP